MAESASFEKALAMAEERRLSEVSLLRSELESERKRREAADTYAQELRTELREETAVLREQLAGESSRCIEIARRAENEVGHLRHCSIDWETSLLPSHWHEIGPRVFISMPHAHNPIPLQNTLEPRPGYCPRTCKGGARADRRLAQQGRRRRLVGSTCARTRRNRGAQAGAKDARPDQFPLSP